MRTDREFGVYAPGKFLGSRKGASRFVATKEYQTWHGIIERSYSQCFKRRWPTYRDCTCSDEFYVFQSFADWMTTQVGFDAKCHVDKDLLIPGNKHYSSETCVLLPHRVNTLLTHKKTKITDLPTGVVESRSKYKAQLNICGKYVNLGSFKTVSEAELAYKLAKEKEIRRIANEHKLMLDPRAYDALINYKV